MNIFQKLFKVIQSFLHAFVNHIQDPILMAEQAIRDLKKDYDTSMKGLAEIKSLAIDTQTKIAEQTEVAKDYEKKALTISKSTPVGLVPVGLNISFMINPTRKTVKKMVRETKTAKQNLLTALNCSLKKKRENSALPIVPQATKKLMMPWLMVWRGNSKTWELLIYVFRMVCKTPRKNCGVSRWPKTALFPSVWDWIKLKRKECSKQPKKNFRQKLIVHLDINLPCKWKKTTSKKAKLFLRRNKILLTV